MKEQLELSILCDAIVSVGEHFVSLPVFLVYLSTYLVQFSSSNDRLPKILYIFQFAMLIVN